MADERRYSVDQVLAILLEWYPLGEFDNISPEQFAELDIDYYDDWYVTFGRKGVYLEWFRGLSNAFQFNATDAEWAPLRKKTTMCELAEFIAARAPFRGVQRATVLGRTCLPAGIFQELAHASRWIAVSDVRVGPSTPLGEVLSKQQRHSLVNRLHVLFRGLGECPDLWHKSAIAGAAWMVLAVAAVCAVLAALLVALGSVIPVLAGGYCAFFGCLMIPMFILLGIVAGLADIGKGPFNRSIRTYRDLVNILSTEARWQWNR